MVFIEIFTTEEVVYTEYFSIDDVTLLEIRKPNNPLASVLDLGAYLGTKYPFGNMSLYCIYLNLLVSIYLF